MRCHHISGKMNPADLVSKHWAYPDVKDTLRTIMFWRGDTAAMDKYDADKKERMAKAAAKKKALTDEGAVDSKPTAEGSERRLSAGTTHSPV